MNVLGISCTGNTAMKLAWKILNVFAMYRVGFWWVLCPFPCDVFAVYLPGTPPLAPSVKSFTNWIRTVDHSACLGDRSSGVLGYVSHVEQKGIILKYIHGGGFSQ